MAGREAGEGVGKRRGSREGKKEESRGMIVWIKDQMWRSSQRKRVLRDEHEQRGLFSSTVRRLITQR